jgi:stress response protein YsnF
MPSSAFQYHLTDTGAVAPTGIGAAESETLRLAEERLTIGKRLVNRGGTRVRRYVVETPVEERVTLDRRPVSGTVTPDAGSFTDRTIEMAETREEAVRREEVEIEQRPEETLATPCR